MSPRGIAAAMRHSVPPGLPGGTGGNAVASLAPTSLLCKANADGGRRLVDEDIPADRAAPEGAPAEDGAGAQAPAAASPEADASGTLAELSALGRRVRSDRHAYWPPLLLFGLIGLGSVPFYLRTPGLHFLGGNHGFSCTDYAAPAFPALDGPPGCPTPLTGLLGLYWLLALTGGFLAVLGWYRASPRRSGVTSRAQAAAITGIGLTVAAVVVPPLAQAAGYPFRLGIPYLAFFTFHGTYPSFIIPVGLSVLSRAGRSRAPTVIPTTYLAASRTPPLYVVHNVVGRLGYWSGSQWYGYVPNMALPTGVLLLSGAAVARARARARFPAAARRTRGRSRRRP